MGRVLVVVPMGPNGNRIKAATALSVGNLKWNGPLDFLMSCSGERVNHFADLADKLNFAGSLALSGGYDGMLIVEYDMIVPEDALEKLAAVDADIVYGLYCARTTTDHQWLVVSDVTEESYKWPSKAQMAKSWGKVIKSNGIGTGCTYIAWRALEKITFRCGAAAPDLYLALDAKQLGLRQMHHCGVVCGHIIDDAAVVWPDPTYPAMHRIESCARVRPLSGVNLYRVLPGQAIANDTSKEVHRAGAVVSLGLEHAAAMLRKGVIECA